MRWLVTPTPDPSSNVLPVAARPLYEDRLGIRVLIRDWVRDSDTIEQLEDSLCDWLQERDAAVAAAALPDAYELAEQLIHDPKWQEGHDFHCVWLAAAALEDGWEGSDTQMHYRARIAAEDRVRELEAAAASPQPETGATGEWLKHNPSCAGFVPREGFYADRCDCEKGRALAEPAVVDDKEQGRA